MLGPRGPPRLHRRPGGGGGRGREAAGGVGGRDGIKDVFGLGVQLKVELNTA